jgi:putative flippase GtrA
VSGYVVNLAVYTALLNGADLHYRSAATGSFVVAVTNNYLLNRLWTFRHAKGHFAFQGLRFFVVALIAYVGNLLILTALVELGLGEIVSQAIAIVLVTPANSEFPDHVLLQDDAETAPSALASSPRSQGSSSARTRLRRRRSRSRSSI